MATQSTVERTTSGEVEEMVLREVAAEGLPDDLEPYRRAHENDHPVDLEPRHHPPDVPVEVGEEEG
jgi:hypothetical protein